MSKKLLVLHAEGIGNFIQLFPLLRSLKEVLSFEIHYCHLFGSYNVEAKSICPYIDKQLSIQDLHYIDPKKYVGKVSTFWGRNHLNTGKLAEIELLSEIHPLSMDKSEVSTYLQIALDLGVVEDQLMWNVNCCYKESTDYFDIVIANGYNKNGNWNVKGFLHYREVAKKLVSKGFKVASIGSKQEYVVGTVPMAGLTLLESFGVIKNAKVLLCNDTGVYHASNALKVPNVTIFTATSTVKNYDPRFHTYTAIVGREGLSCRPCQAYKGWVKCRDWECQDIDPEIIVQEVLSFLNN